MTKFLDGIFVLSDKRSCSLVFLIVAYRKIKSSSQYITIQHYAVQRSIWCIAQCCTMQCSKGQYNAVLCSTVMYSKLQYSTVQYSTVHRDGSEDFVVGRRCKGPN